MVLWRGGRLTPSDTFGTHFEVRNIARETALVSAEGAVGRLRRSSSEVAMATQRQGHIVETPTEARQAEPGPSVLALLTISTGLAVLILGFVWFVFFHT
jgi:hypothetical protein